MTNAAKRKAILFLLLAVLVTVLLAAALPQLELQKGVPLPGGNNRFQAAPSEPAEPFLAIGASTLLKTIIGVFFVSLFIYYLFGVKKGAGLKEWIKPILALAVFSLALTLLLYSFSNVQVNMTLAEPAVLPNQLPVVGPELGPVPVSWFWVVWVILAALVLLVVISMLRVRFKPREVSEDALAQEAKEAVAALKAGQDFSNVIVRCYQQMSQVLKKEQGLTMEESMTAREFEALLEKRGVPNPPVRQLTRLFEIARYAAQSPGPAEEAQAVDCLNAIAQYSQKRGARRA